MSLVSKWAETVRSEVCFPWNTARKEPELQDENSLDNIAETSPPQKSKFGLGKYGSVVAAGAGLFSDGYVNNSISAVNTILKRVMGDTYTNSPAQSNVASIAFAGTVVGQLFFGYVADYHSRKIGMIASTIILILFTILAAGAWGADGGYGYGMLAALTAYRFFLGIGIGGEYPAGSVAAAEASQQLGRGKRNRWFVLFTNFMIDTGFVVSAFVPLVLLWICGEDHLTPVWRVTLGIGAIPPCSLLVLRFFFNENPQFRKNNMKRVRTPYWLVLKYYFPRLVIVSLIWFIYDFSAYSFGIFSSQILSTIIPPEADGTTSLYKTFGWNVVLNLFYIPGSFLGAYAADYLGPRLTLTIGVGLQGIIGFCMAAKYETLSKHIAGFTVVFGIFTTLGEFGPGDNIGLIASKTSATAIRGQYYGIAAAVGKIGAFVGTYVFPVIIANFGGNEDPPRLESYTVPFYISSALCLFSAALALFCLPSLTQDAVNDEDVRFREYLLNHGFDVSKMGDADSIETQYVDASSPGVEDRKNM